MCISTHIVKHGYFSIIYFYFRGVTHTPFEGCIMDMLISAEVIDLNKNKEALGVANGCPVTVCYFEFWNLNACGITF